MMAHIRMMINILQYNCNNDDTIIPIILMNITLI